MSRVMVEIGIATAEQIMAALKTAMNAGVPLEAKQFNAIGNLRTALGKAMSDRDAATYKKSVDVREGMSMDEINQALKGMPRADRRET